MQIGAYLLLEYSLSICEPVAITQHRTPQEDSAWADSLHTRTSNHSNKHCKYCCCFCTCHCTCQSCLQSHSHYHECSSYHSSSSSSSSRSHSISHPALRTAANALIFCWACYLCTQGSTESTLLHFCPRCSTQALSDLSKK